MTFVDLAAKDICQTLPVLSQFCTVVGAADGPAGTCRMQISGVDIDGLVQVEIRRVTVGATTQITAIFTSVDQ